MHISDSSPFGFGVCTTNVDLAEAASIGRIDERWRCRCADAIAARSHALSIDALSFDAAALKVNTDMPLSACDVGELFAEVPVELLCRK